MMTNDKKINFTLRIKKLVDQKLTKASSEIGISKNAFILMILSEKLEERNSKGEK